MRIRSMVYGKSDPNVRQIERVELIIGPYPDETEESPQTSMGANDEAPQPTLTGGDYVDA